MKKTSAISCLIIISFAPLILTSCGQSAEDKRIAAEVEASKKKASECQIVRKEYETLIESRNSKYELTSINNLQAELFTLKIKQLFEQGKIADEEWKLFNYVTKNNPLKISNSTDRQISSKNTSMENYDIYFKNLMKLQAVVGLWIKNGLISPYFFPEVVARGDKLAKSEKPQYSYLLNNSECFSELEISMAKSFKNLKLKSNWGSKKTAAELLNVYN